MRRMLAISRVTAFFALLITVCVFQPTCHSYGMGFFEKETRPSPGKQQLEQEAEGVRGQITTWRDKEIARAKEGHVARMAPTEERIEAGNREMVDMGQKAMLGLHCMQLMVDLLNPLTKALRRGGVPDMRTAMRALHDEIEQHTEAFKRQPTRESLEAFEAWATERAGAEAEAVRKGFDAFRQKLQKEGIDVG